MKKQIKLIALMIAVICITSSMRGEGEVIIETTDKASTGQEWNFEIFNKSGTPILVTLEDQQVPLLVQHIDKSMVLKNGKLRASGFNTNHQFIIKIWTINQHNTGLPITQELFPQGKTMYVTFNKNKELLPQTGVLGGFSLGFIGGRTHSGLDNTNNISSRNIR
jgi:hypothetical protein